MKLKSIPLLLLLPALMLLLGGGAPSVDIEATVEARVAEERAAEAKVEATKDIAASVTAEAAVAARATWIAEAKGTPPMSLADAIATVVTGRDSIRRP
jgi:hypothetical protein